MGAAAAAGAVATVPLVGRAEAPLAAAAAATLRRIVLTVAVPRVDLLVGAAADLAYCSALRVGFMIMWQPNAPGTRPEVLPTAAAVTAAAVTAAAVTAVAVTAARVAVPAAIVAMRRTVPREEALLTVAALAVATLRRTVAARQGAVRVSATAAPVIARA